MKADTRGQLAWVCDHFNIEGATPDLLDEVVAAASKAEMAKRSKPKAKLRSVRMGARPADEWYSDEDRRFVTEVCRRYLKHTFGLSILVILSPCYDGGTAPWLGRGWTIV